MTRKIWRGQDAYIVARNIVVGKRRWMYESGWGRNCAGNFESCDWSDNFSD